jgi:hypothetical protein
MTTRRQPPESFGSRQRVLELARDELDAARTLIAGLDGGGRPACVHLVRATAALRSVVDSLEDEESAPDTPQPKIDPEDFDPPGLSEQALGDWRERMPMVIALAGPIDGGDEHDRREVERSARTVHDLLDRSILWTEHELRRRFFPDRWSTRALWIAAAVVLCVAAAALVLSNLEPRSQPPPTPREPRQTARRASQVRQSELATPRPPGTPWDAPGAIIIPKDPGHLVVTLDRPCRAAEIEISLDNNDRYRIEFLAEGAPVGASEVGPVLDRGGLIPYRVPAPDPMPESGFDAVRVTPVQGDESWSVGHLTLHEVGASGESAEPTRDEAD